MLGKKPVGSRQLLLGEQGVLFWGVLFLFKKKRAQEEVADQYTPYQCDKCTNEADVQCPKESGKSVQITSCRRFHL